MVNGHKYAAHSDSPDGDTGKTCLGEVYALSQCQRSTAPARHYTDAFMSRIAEAVVKDTVFQQLSHPPYAPDLAPSDFYPFRHPKKHLRCTRFCDDNEIKQAMESYLDNMPQEFV